MVPASTSLCNAGGHQLRSRSDIGKRHPERTGCPERQSKILLVKRNPETWIEAALDHSRAMHV